MSKFFHTALVLALSLSVGLSYSPSVMAKKDHSNSNSDDDNDKNDNKDKKNKNDNDQNSKSKNSNSQQFQKFQSSNQQFKFNKSDNSDKSDNGQSQKFQSNNKFPFVPQGQGGSKQFQPQNSKQFNGQNFQNFQKQNNPPQNFQKQNIQLQGVKDKPDWIEKSHHDHKDVKKFVVNFGGAEPFSAKWYKDHPKAWHYHHDHDNAWKVVTAAGIVGFLGWEAYHTHGPVIVYQPVPYETLFVSRPGVIIDPAVGDWMPLGQFSLMLGPADSSTRMLDLAVDRFGDIRGSYYDMVSGVSHNVAGIVDGRTQYAQWSLESNRGLTFYTPLGEMMQPQGLVYVQLPSGERQQWQLVRMDAGY